MSAVLPDALEQHLVEKAHEKKGAECRGGCLCLPRCGGSGAGLGFHLPVGRIILHNTMLVELDLCLEPATLVLVCSVAEAGVGLPAGCDCHLRELDPGRGDLARLSRSQVETFDREHV